MLDGRFSILPMSLYGLVVRRTFAAVSFMEILLYPMNLFIEHPYLALLPAFAFGAVYASLYRKRGAGPRRFVLLTAVVWVLYAIYEWRMSIWARTVTAPIRVDLLLIAPVLYFVTLIGLLASVTGFRRVADKGA